MFDDLIKKMKHLNNQKISIPISTDKDGYLDKQCPSKNCRYYFKVSSENWENIFQNEVVFCPLCKHEAKADEFITKEQLEEAKELAYHYLNSEINKALKLSANKFNASQKNDSFIKIRMNVAGSSITYNPLLPISAKEVLEQKITCDQCGVNYAILGSAFFCPNCGNNSIEKTFNSSISKIENKIKYLDQVKKSIPNKDEAENTCRSLIETGLSDCVVSFQFFCDRFYDKNLNKQSKIPFNVFQKIYDGEELWRKLFGEAYSDWLNQQEYRNMEVFFQRRHLLTHKEGIVDQKYIDKSKDPSYSLGQRIVVNPGDVINLVKIIIKITDKILELANAKNQKLDTKK